MMAKIKVIDGASIENYHYENWLKYWKKYSEEPVLYCAERSCLCCGNLIGTHVKKTNGDHNIYIIPLCPIHHSNKHEIHVNNHTKFVPLHQEGILELV